MVPKFEKRVRIYAIEISALAVAIIVSSLGFGGIPFLQAGIIVVVYMFVTIVPLLLSKGQSYGKRIQKIKVVKLDGTPVNPFILILREFFKTGLSLLTFGIYSIIAYFALTEKEVSRTIHDYIFKTKVIDLDTTKKKHNRDNHFLGTTDSMKKRPELFETDIIAWNKNNSIEPLIKRLNEIRKDQLFTDGIFNLENKEKAVLSYNNRKDYLLGVFNLEDDKSLVVPLKDGIYTNLINDDEVVVKDNLINNLKEPIIIKTLMGNIV